MPNVVVIGAGAAGISAALELARRNYKVTLFEKDTLGSGSSGRNPARMGHGFHYVDKETAKIYLGASIQVQRAHPHYLVGKELPFEHPLRHGRYFITKNSDNPPDVILGTYTAIQQEYSRLVAEDRQNEVFGPPEKFFRILNPAEYEGVVNPDIVEFGVETAEHLFDWQAFIKDIKAKIVANENIQLCENAEVTQIERGELDKPRFVLHIKHKTTDATEKETLEADYIVNSTWQNIENLNSNLGITMIPGARTNRLKSLLIVKLPESLLNANSMFFCMGQHCMFSNIGNGYGMMTFANVTNMETSTGLKLTEFANRLLEGGATQEEKDTVSRAMLKGVANYIPEMANAEIIDVKFGIVQTAGTLSLEDLKDPSSSFHKRDYDGIREEQVGLISNPCMKLFYFERNGNTVADCLDTQRVAESCIQEIMQKVKTLLDESDLKLKKDVEKAILINMEKNTSSPQVKDICAPSPEAKGIYTTSMSNTLFNGIKKKAALKEEIAKRPPSEAITSMPF